jgi:hypothetical protein
LLELVRTPRDGGALAAAAVDDGAGAGTTSATGVATGKSLAA